MRVGMMWRVLSFLTLLIYAALLVAGLLLFVQNIVLASIFALTCLFLVYGAWLLFAGGDMHRKTADWLTITAGVALFAETIYFLSDQKNRRTLLVIAILIVVYLLLFGLLRQKYWTTKRKQLEQHSKTKHFTNPYLIINPKSGNGRAVKADIPKLAKDQGIHVIMTKKGVDISDSALQAVRAGADVLGISGGDGSIGAVAKVAMDHGLPMVVLPGGTRCHFARDLGLDPKRIIDSLAGFKGVERQIDVAEINGRVFLNNASFGLYADIVDRPDYRDHKVRVTRSVLRDIVANKKKPYELRFKHGKTVVNRAVQVLVGVNQYNTMKVSELGHRERLDEGVLQVTTITKLDTALVKQMLMTIRISQLITKGEVRGIYQWVDKTFTVKSGRKKIVVGVDGEREEYATPVKVRIKPQALRIYVPAEGVRPRAKNPLSISTVRDAWKTVRR